MTAMSELQSELAKSSVLAVETVQEIQELKSKVNERDKQVSVLKNELKESKELHKKLLDKSIKHTEADIYLQCAKIMDEIKSGKSVEDTRKALEFSRAGCDALLEQRRQMMGATQLGHRGGLGFGSTLGSLLG